MALDPTIGGSVADSYISEDDLRTYWDDIGFDYSSFDDTAVEVAARKATIWLDGVYGRRFGGSRVNGRSQALIWPRVDVYDCEGQVVDADTIPTEVVNATAQAARYAISGTDLTPEVTTGQAIKREKIGPMETEYVSNGLVDAQRPVLTVVDDILANLLGNSGNTQLVERA